MVKGPLAVFKGFQKQWGGELRKHIISLPENALKGVFKETEWTLQSHDLNNAAHSQ